MQVVERIGNFNPAQLMDELIQQVPAFRRVTAGVADSDTGIVEGTENTVRVTFADDIPNSVIIGVVDAHSPVFSRRDWANELSTVSSLADLKMFLRDYLGI